MKPLVTFALVLVLIYICSGTVQSAAATPDEGRRVSEKGIAINVTPVQLPARKPPARDFPVLQTLSVTDFGAVPDDGNDDLAGVRAAMSKAQDLREPTAVVLPKGTYDLFLPADADRDLIYGTTRNCLAFYQASKIILDGQGSTIMIHEPTLGFLTLLACKDMVVRNFIVDWETPPFAQGFVRSVDREAGWFELEETPGFMSLEAPLWQEENRKGYDSIRWGMLKDRVVPGRMKANVRNAIFLKHWEKIGTLRFRLHLRNRACLEDFEIGDPYVHVDRNGGGLCIFSHCERVTIENITSYTSPGLDYGGAHSSEIGLFKCRVLVKPGYRHTSNADGMHFSQHRIGPWVEGCTFEGMADDGANLYAHPTNVVRVISDKDFEIGFTVDWRPGDQVMGLEPKKGKVLGVAGVVSAPMDRQKGTTRLVLDGPIPGMQPGEHKDKEATYFLNLNLSSSNFVFRNNTFRNVRRFGILMQSHDGIVEGNTFENVSASAIVVRNSSGWPEGFATGNIAIRGNTIRNCNFDHNVRAYNTGDITVYVRRLDGRNGLSRAISRVEIQDNTIINTRRRAINLASATDVTVTGNVIRCEDPKAPSHDDAAVTPIRLCDVDRVTIRDNAIIEPRPVRPGGVTIEGECTAVDVRGNRFEESNK